jgi:hypothetical protein
MKADVSFFSIAPRKALNARGPLQSRTSQPLLAPLRRRQAQKPWPGVVTPLGWRREGPKPSPARA